MHIKQIKKNPTLGIILVGNDPSSIIYVNRKIQFCNKLNINC